MRSLIRRTLTGVCCLVLVAILAAGCAEPPAAQAANSMSPGPKAPKAAGEPLPARLEVTIYGTQVPAGRAPTLDAGSLAAQAGKAEGFRKSLAGIGRTKVLYHVDQAVNLSSKSRIRLGARVPFVSASRAMRAGATVNTVQYESVGADLRIAGQLTRRGRSKHVTVQLEVELSAITPSGVEVSKGVKARVVRNVTLSYDGPVELGRPVVVVGVDASSEDADAEASAYVVRAVLSDLRP
jgi:hypothetical protein